MRTWQLLRVTLADLIHSTVAIALCKPIIFGLIFFLACIHTTLLAQTYEVAGSIHSKSYFGHFIDETWQFKVSINKCEWFLHEVPQEVKFGGVLQTNNFDYVEASFDGIQYYVVYSMGTITKRFIASLPKQDQGTQQTATAIVGMGIIPEDAGSHVRDLWLGFASHCYLGSQTNDWLYPLFMSRVDALSFSGPFKVKCFLDFQNGGKYLPSKLIYTYQFAAKTTEKIKTSDLSGTNAIFEDYTHTNLGGAIIPTHYTIKRYSMSGQLTSESDIHAEICNDSTSFTNFIPSLPGNTYVSDLRFSPIGQYQDAHYYATNWPASVKVEKIYKTEVKQNAEQLEYKKFMSDDRKKWNHNVRIAVVSIMFISSFVPLFIYHFSKRKQ